MIPGYKMKDRIKVTIVDDEKAYREVIKLIFAKDKRISLISEFTQGQDFINSLSSLFKPDVCLFDIKLSGGDSGINCAQAVKAQYPNIHVILITAYPKPQTLIEAKKLHADYIEKGTIGEILIDKIITSVEPQQQFISLQYDTEKKYAGNYMIFCDRFGESQTNSSTLTDNQKKIIKLRQQGKTINETAEILNMKANTVTSHLERALRKLNLPNPLHYIDIDWNN